MTAATVAPVGHRIRNGLGWSMAGNIVMRVGNFLISLVMARLIAPEQFGVFAVALTVANILGTLAEFGLGADLVRADDVERRAPTVATLGLATSGLLAISMMVAAGSIAAAFKSPESEGVIRLMAVSIAIFGLAIVPAARLQRDFRQRAVFAMYGVGMICSAVTMTVLAVEGAGPAALAWGQIALQSAVVVMAFMLTRTRPKFGFDRDIAVSSLSFCAPLAVANMLSWAVLSVDNLVVARALGTTNLGLYALAFNISTWPMNAIGQAVRVIALPAFAQVEHPSQRNRLLVRCAGPTVAVATLGAVTLATLATPIVTVLYGEPWQEAAAALTGLAVFGGLRVVIDLWATFLVAVGVTTWVLLVQVAWMVTMIPAMYLSVRAFGLAGAGWGHVMVAGLVILPLFGVGLSRVGVDVRAFLRGGIVPVLAVVPVVPICWWIGSRQLDSLVLLVVGCAAVLLLYALPLSRWWLRSIDEMRRPLAVADEVASP